LGQSAVGIKKAATMNFGQAMSRWRTWSGSKEVDIDVLSQMSVGNSPPWSVDPDSGTAVARQGQVVFNGPNSYSGYMKEIAARDAKNQFGQLLESAQRGPVRVLRRGRPAGVLLSEEQYQRLRGLAWDRLQATISSMRTQAADQGLTEEKLAEILADEH
jgi:prevent-host-death family protein